MFQYGTGLGLLLIVAMIIRGFGRRFNPTYTTFIKVLNKAGNYRPSLEDMVRYLSGKSLR